jgi:hypothetical protein
MSGLGAGRHAAAHGCVIPDDLESGELRAVAAGGAGPEPAGAHSLDDSDGGDSTQCERTSRVSADISCGTCGSRGCRTVAGLLQDWRFFGDHDSGDTQDWAGRPAGWNRHARHSTPSSHHDTRSNPHRRDEARAEPVPTITAPLKHLPAANSVFGLELRGPARHHLEIGPP